MHEKGKIKLHCLVEKFSTDLGRGIFILQSLRVAGSFSTANR